MRRRSTASSKLAKARSRKAKALKAVRQRSSSPAGQETEVARLTRELSEAQEQQTATAALRSIPIIAVTSYALPGEEKKARAAGCEDYVTKPFSPRQLLAKIRQYLP